MDKKPMLTIPEQIEHLKNKGITFECVSEAEAADYLEYNNNYFKLASYRKNYDKYTSGEKAGQYVNLDFGYLRDLAIIDMSLRYACVQVSLDIEHYAKLEMLRLAMQHNEDGYQIITDFVNSLDPRQRVLLDNEFARSRNSVYCAELYSKYHDCMPIWVFMEIIPFGRLASLYGFCAQRYTDKDMRERHFMLKTCKEIRNACAHSSCVLNDLRPGSIKYSTAHSVQKHVSEVGGISRYSRNQRLSNIRIQHVVTLFHVHSVIVTSPGVHLRTSKLASGLGKRMMRHIDYYDSNELVKSSLKFISSIIQAWFSEEKKLEAAI